MQTSVDTSPLLKVGSGPSPSPRVVVERVGVSPTLKLSALLMHQGLGSGWHLGSPPNPSSQLLACRVSLLPPGRGWDLPASLLSSAAVGLWVQTQLEQPKHLL